MCLSVVKRHKRLHIVDEAGASVYTPPDFVKVQSREAMASLATSMRGEPADIELIAAFEADPRNRPDLRKRARF